jgi:Holliday junction resolvasome RuvABC endonuclease subunit
MVTVFMGIDPGISGGIAVIRKGKVSHTSMPSTERDVWEWIRWWQDEGDILVPDWSVMAMIEQVGGYIGEAQPGSAAFRFGQSYGGLRMALTAADIPFQAVVPKTWQKTFSLTRGKSEAKTAWKNRIKAKAQQLFPSEKVTLAIADALLIAEHCRRTNQPMEGRMFT